MLIIQPQMMWSVGFQVELVLLGLHKHMKWWCTVTMVSFELEDSMVPIADMLLRCYQPCWVRRQQELA